MREATQAHVFAADQGISLQDETIESMTYDDATQLLLVIKARHARWALFARLLFWGI